MGPSRSTTLSKESCGVCSGDVDLCWSIKGLCLLSPLGMANLPRLPKAPAALTFGRWGLAGLDPDRFTVSGIHSLFLPWCQGC